MAGIRILERDGEIRLHPTVGSSQEDVPVVFIVVKDGGTALAHPDWVDSRLYDIDCCGVPLEDTWDVLMVKTPTMPYPEVCRVRMLTGTGGGAEILVGSHIVHRFKGMAE